MSRNDIDSADDRTTELLRQALADEAATVRPSPGALQEIERRTASHARDSRRARRRWMIVTPLGAGLAAAAAIFGIVLLNGGSNSATHKPPAVSHPQQRHAGAYDPNAPASEQLSVWYVGPDPADPRLKPRLFGETHTVADPGSDAQLAAVHELLTSTPIDPDYRNPWPDGVDISGISESSGVTEFDLSYDGSDGAFPQDATMRMLAFQMLAKAAGLDSGAFGVCVNGTCDDVAYEVQPDEQVRAFITIDNIVDGQSVTNPVTVKVSGNVFEGNVNWQLLDANGDKVKEGYLTLSMGTWTQGSVDLGALDPGTYTFKALEYSAKDGSPINLDDKTFTVE